MSEWYAKRTFGALVDDMAARFSAREALVFNDERRTVNEVRERVDEVARGLIALGDSLEQRAESSGYCAPGYACRVVDTETGVELPVGVPGEIVFEGYGMMLGYYKKPVETAARYDADGYVRFLGRYKDMLEVGGENVGPMEIEGLLPEVAGVQRVAVISLPDARLSAVPVAFVQRAADSHLNEQDVIDYRRGKVATFKIPRDVLFSDAFPMTASGKIRKVELRAEARRHAFIHSPTQRTLTPCMHSRSPTRSN